MRGGGGGRKEREREEVLYTVGARNGSVARKMLRGGKRCGAMFFSEHTHNSVGRSFLDSLENNCQRIQILMRICEIYPFSDCYMYY